MSLEYALLNTPMPMDLMLLIKTIIPIANEIEEIIADKAVAKAVTAVLEEDTNTPIAISTNIILQEEKVIL